MSVFTVGCDPYASRWWVGDGMLTRRERLSAAGRLREWWTVRRVGRAHASCARALTYFEATLLLPSAVDYARMIEAVERLSGEYYRASERLKLRGGDARGVSVETLWLARLQMFSCVWLAEMNARFPGKVGGSRVVAGLLWRAEKSANRTGRTVLDECLNEADEWALTFRRAAQLCERWVEPPMSCIMDACSKTRVVDRDGSILYELPLSE